MEHESDSHSEDSAALMQSMALLATLQTAFDVWEGVRSRRAGVDPTEQETEAAARFHLRRALDELRELYHQLVLVQVCSNREERLPSGDGLAVPVRHFDLLTKLTRVSRLLQSVHQRLLSLYPLVDGDLVERARQLQVRTEKLSTGDAESGTTQMLLPRLHEFLKDVAEACTR